MLKTLYLFLLLLSSYPLLAQEEPAYKVMKKSKPKAELLAQLKPYPEAHREMVSAFRIKSMSTVSTMTGVMLMGIPAGMALAGNDFNWTLAGIGFGLVVVSIPLHSIFKKKSNRALRIYEDELMQPFNTRMAFVRGW
ncbi:MAG: hypothetical protein RLO17_13735 [Cyclobacteriaceae bacterium]